MARPRRVLAAIFLVILLAGLSNQAPISPPGFGDNGLARFNEVGSFKIAIFSDTHFGENAWNTWGPQQDINTVKVMEAVLDADPPSMVVFNGDLITGDNAYAHNATAVLDQMVAPLVARNLPWASTYGNHDSQFNLSSQDLLAHEQRYPGAMTKMMVGGREEGTSNYVVPVYASDCPGAGTCAPEMLLWFFDSRGGFYPHELNVDGTPVSRPNWVHDKVVAWFQRTNADLVAQYQKTIPSLAFVHIPTSASAALQALGVDPNRQPGVNDDPVAQQSQGWCPDGRTQGCHHGGQDLAFMQAVTSTPGLMALFSGHSHGVTWCYRWDAQAPVDSGVPAGNGVNLCFGQHSGYGGCGNWIRGAREVVVTREQLARLEVDTYMRLENGEVVGAVTLNATYNQDWYEATPNLQSSCPTCDYRHISPMPGTGGTGLGWLQGCQR
ncbi:hypothetical protein S40288_04780 [Stachybotrys chartarum IBT 40288]|nr:hypothetical protein S40288_04780 [Stachybotrys chartarum IBT 40288]